MPKRTVYTLLCTSAHPACHMDGISLHESLSFWDAYIGSAIPSLALKMANGRTLLVKLETSHQRTFDLVNQPQSCQPASQFSKTLLTITLTLLPWMFLPHAGLWPAKHSKSACITVHTCMLKCHLDSSSTGSTPHDAIIPS